MIVRLGNKATNKAVEEFCNRILDLPDTSRKNTPKRCIILHKKDNLASIGAGRDGIDVEFRPKQDDYAAAHGANYVKPHANALLAKEGWLQAWPENEEAVEQLIGWIRRAAAARD